MKFDSPPEKTAKKKAAKKKAAKKERAPKGWVARKSGVYETTGSLGWLDADITYREGWWDWKTYSSADDDEAESDWGPEVYESGSEATLEAAAKAAEATGD